MLALPHRVRKEISIGPCRVRAPHAGLEIRRKKTTLYIYNNSRFSILLLSASDPKKVLVTCWKKYGGREGGGVN